MSMFPRCGDFSLREVIDHAADGLFLRNGEGRVVLFTRGCERLTGLPAESVIGATSICDRLPECRDEYGRPLSGDLCPWPSILSDELTSGSQRTRIVRADGSCVWLETTCTPWRDCDGDIVGIVGIMRDITERRTLFFGPKSADRFLTFDPASAEAAVNSRARLAPNDQPSTAESQSGIVKERTAPLDDVLYQAERDKIIAALTRTEGRRSEAARLLGISRSRLYRRMAALKINPRGEASQLAGESCEIA